MLDNRENLKRVVITGLGVIAPNGNNVKEFTKAIQEGISGIDTISNFSPESFVAKLGAEVKNFSEEIHRKNYPELDLIKDRKIFLGLQAFEETLLSSGLSKNDLNQTGIITGTSLETFYIKSLMELSPHHFDLKTFMENYHSQNVKNKGYLQTPINFLGEFLLKKYQLKGPVYANCSACTASTQALGRAFDLISSGRKKLMFAGGFDSLINPLGIGGFSVLGALNTANELGPKASMPFDVKRKGIVIGEGAAFFVLEELEHAKLRNAEIYAEILGHASTLDAYKFTSPPPDGNGTAKAMEIALQKAKLPIEKIDYINAHGTSTILNDVIETKAIKTVFGPKARELYVSSLKSMIGHLVGASGAVELAGCVQMLRNSFIAPTINLEISDPECDLNYVPQKGINKDIWYILKNSMGFGGQNSSMVLAKYPND